MWPSVAQGTGVLMLAELARGGGRKSVGFSVPTSNSLISGTSAHLSVGVPRHQHYPCFSPTPHQSSPAKHLREISAPRRIYILGPAHLACPSLWPEPATSFQSLPASENQPAPRPTLRLTAALVSLVSFCWPGFLRGLPRAPRLKRRAAAQHRHSPTGPPGFPEAATIRTRTIGPSKGRRRRRRKEEEEEKASNMFMLRMLP